MTKRKILWGVCGIGHGHTFRQLPLIEHFSKDSDIVIFAYGESYAFFKKHFSKNLNITIEKVAVPFFVGSKTGLDFEATAKHPSNQNIDFQGINAKAMAKAKERIEKPDMVVTDYEPISAQYAYAHNAPLITLDQQSKYLTGDFPEDLNGQGYKDEIERLRMMFPKAHKRLACSFFKSFEKPNISEKVEIVPPTLKDEIINLDRKPNFTGKEVLVYLSLERLSGQSVSDIAQICKDMPDITFRFFGKGLDKETSFQCVKNIRGYNHGDSRFYDILSTCNGAISTAGHSFLSEAMYLGIPVYAIPFPIYEQQMNAHMINTNGFGVSHDSFDAQKLRGFINSIPQYQENIENDKTVLMRGIGQGQILQILDV